MDTTRKTTEEALIEKTEGRREVYRDLYFLKWRAKKLLDKRGGMCMERGKRQEGGAVMRRRKERELQVGKRSDI